MARSCPGYKFWNYPLAIRAYGLPFLGEVTVAAINETIVDYVFGGCP